VRDGSTRPRRREGVGEEAEEEEDNKEEEQLGL